MNQGTLVHLMRTAIVAIGTTFVIPTGFPSNDTWMGSILTRAFYRVMRSVPFEAVGRRPVSIFEPNSAPHVNVCVKISFPTTMMPTSSGTAAMMSTTTRAKS
jgi:hypothetical protein